MSVDAAAPCFMCGKVLPNAYDSEDVNNQPYGATEFTTQGHYGSTFYDPMSGREELVLNVCDDHLREHKNRLVVRRTAPQRTVECTYHTLDEVNGAENG